MSGRARLALCAAAATLMASCALLPLVDPATWLFQAAFLLAVQSGVGALTRRVPLARPLTVAVQALVTLMLLTLVFARRAGRPRDHPGARGVPAVRGAAAGRRGRRRAVRDPGAAVRRHPADAGRRCPGDRARGGRARGDVPQRGPGRTAAARAVLGRRGAVRAAVPQLAVVPARGRRLSDAAAGRGPRPALAVGPRLRRRPPRRRAPGPSAGAVAPVRTGRRIGAVALGIALVVPLALPSLDGGLLDGAGAGVGSGSGGGGTISAVNPLVSLRDSLNVDEDREVMSYRTNTDETQDMYLRIVSLDDFDGTAWKPAQRHIDRCAGHVPDADRPRRATSSAPRSRPAISAADWYAQDWLPMPYPASRVDIDGRWRYEPVGRTLVGDHGQNTRGVQYDGHEPARAADRGAARATRRSRIAALKREFTEVPGVAAAGGGARPRARSPRARPTTTSRRSSSRTTSP